MPEPEFVLSIGNTFTSPNSLFLTFPAVSPGMYRMLALIQLSPPSGYTPYSGDFEVLGSLSYPSGGTLATLVTTIGYILRGHTTVNGVGPGYTTVSFDTSVPLSFVSGVKVGIYLPTWSQHSGKEVGYLIRVG